MAENSTHPGYNEYYEEDYGSGYSDVSGPLGRGTETEAEKLLRQAQSFGITGVTQQPLGAMNYEFGNAPTGEEWMSQLSPEQLQQLWAMFGPGTGGIESQIRDSLAADPNQYANAGGQPGAIEAGLLPPLGLLPSKAFAEQLQEDQQTKLEKDAKWYNPANLIPKAIAGVGALMTGGLLAPVAAGLSPIVGGALQGAGAGLSGSVLSGGMSGNLNFGDVLQGTLTGAASGGLLAGAKEGIGALMSGSNELAGVDFNSIPVDDPFRAEITGMAAEMGMDPQDVLNMLSDMPQVSQLDSLINSGVNAFDPLLYQTGGSETLSGLGSQGSVATDLGLTPSGEYVPDIFGRTPATDYALDTSTEFDRISDINHPDNMSQYIKDLYRTGNTQTLSDLGFMTDSGAALGLTPSNAAIPDAGVALTDRNIGLDLAKKILGSVGGGGQIPDMGSPRTIQLPTAGSGYAPAVSGGQQGVGAGMGLGPNIEGSNVAHSMTQQYGAVRPMGLETYTQDLLAMAQESPDILENPMIYNMLAEQLMGGGTRRRPGMDMGLNLEDTTGMVA